MKVKSKLKPGSGLPLILGAVTFVLLGIGMRGENSAKVLASPSPAPALVASSSEIGEASTLESSSTLSLTSEPEDTPSPTETPVPTPVEAATPEPTPTPSPESSEPSQVIVYWTPNGGSYHSSENCRTLSRSKTIISGTIDEAVASGHGDPCDVCY